MGPDEGWRPTSHPAIREVVSPGLGKEEDLAWVVERLETLAREGKSDELVRALKNAVQATPERVEEDDVPERAKGTSHAGQQTATDQP